MLSYGAETWTISKTMEQLLVAFERCMALWQTASNLLVTAFNQWSGTNFDEGETKSASEI